MPTVVALSAECRRVVVDVASDIIYLATFLAPKVGEKVVSVWTKRERKIPFIPG